MSSPDTIIDQAKIDIAARLDKVKADIKAIPAPAPTPTVTFQDNFDSTYSLTDGQTSPDGKWYLKWLSGGKCQSANGVMNIVTVPATAITQTYSIVLLSKQIFKNFQLDLDLKTNRQTRINTPPKSWETAWVFFRYTDEAPRSVHHYYWLMKTDGYEFGKKDNAPGDTSPEKQVFIRTGPLPKAVIGQNYHVTVKAVNKHFTISVNGAIVIDMDDLDIHDPTKMSQGNIGLYIEDCDGTYDNVKLQAL